MKPSVALYFQQISLLFIVFASPMETLIFILQDFHCFFSWLFLLFLSSNHLLQKTIFQAPFQGFSKYYFNEFIKNFIRKYWFFVFIDKKNESEKV